MSKETCYECNAETGNAGTGDGSLIVKGNPYCDDCYQEEVQKAFDERDKLEKERDELKFKNDLLSENYNNADECARQREVEILKLIKERDDLKAFIRLNWPVKKGKIK